MEVAIFTDLLKKNGRFATKARLSLFEILQSRPALTMQELIGLTKGHDPVTTYRNIDLFEKLGIVNRLRLGWLTKIELSDSFIHHHHHLSCTNCGQVMVLPEDEDIESRIYKLSRLKNFKPMDHQLEIRGLCLSCQQLPRPGS